ncbi:uncharacterized protein LOC118202405 isoform X1 [Stegodyphus dumicola]|uniref:uncharacterized protein LOC118202405 isoform X1 n=2 Tax=Stegodyphus dumicola TaxID=202533 RepID=UPI0015ABC2D3|nr:uncharacterized protein LOC118202405 isoform X1 [Stegodyphus dumicola]
MVNYLSLYKLSMMISVFFTLIFFAWVQAQCPEENNIAPCKCVTPNGEVNVLCRGEIGLPRLTEILMKTFCGETIKKFELIQSDIDYLPSNLFYKVIVKDIQVSFTNISHFTRAGISAFFGQERYLESLSMRRCHLVNGLQWQMIGDLQVLTYLDLSFNDLSRIPEQWFKHPPPNLRSLTLKGNKIRALESGAFLLHAQASPIGCIRKSNH